MRATAYGVNLPNFGNTIDSVLELGVEIAICDAATQFLAAQIAAATGAEVGTAYEELKANAVPGRFVSAGVMALTRAQEYGYSLLYAG
jgi:predicted peroxiredoxin